MNNTRTKANAALHSKIGSVVILVLLQGGEVIECYYKNEPTGYKEKVYDLESERHIECK